MSTTKKTIKEEPMDDDEHEKEREEEGRRRRDDRWEQGRLTIKSELQEKAQEQLDHERQQEEERQAERIREAEERAQDSLNDPEEPTNTKEGGIPEQILRSLPSETLQVHLKTFTVNNVHNSEIHGCVLRNINVDHVSILNKIPVTTLFDEKTSSMPVFLMTPNLPNKIVVVEGNHRVSSLLGRDGSEEEFVAEVCLVEEADFLATFDTSPNLAGSVADVSKKCSLAEIPWIVASFVQQIFTSERLRCENGYSPKERAVNLMEILKARVKPEDMKMLIDSARARTKLYTELVTEHLAIQSTESQTERSGMYVFLSAPRTSKLFGKYFDQIPTKEKTHLLLFKASHMDDVKCANLIKDLSQKKMERMTFFQKIKDFKNAVGSSEKSGDDEEEKPPKKSGQLIVWSHASQVPLGSFVILQGSIPEPKVLADRKANVAVIAPPQTKQFLETVIEHAPTDNVRRGIYRKTDFIAFGDAVQPGDHFSTSTFATLVQRLTSTTDNRKRKLDANTTNMTIGTISRFEPE